LPGSPVVGAIFVHLEGPLSAHGSAARLSLLAAPSTEVGAGEGVARFSWLAARFEGCPVDWPLGTMTSFAPCAALEAGRLHGEGLRAGAIAHPSSDSLAWMAASASGRFRMEIGASMFSEVQAGVLVPLTRPRFSFASPDVHIYRAPPAAPQGEIGLGIAFP
jgi:hypothetical protein